MQDPHFLSLSHVQTEEMLRHCREKLRETLDEISQIELAVQELVLRVLKHHSFPREGQSVSAYIRLVALQAEEEISLLHRYIRQLKADLAQKEKLIKELEARQSVPPSEPESGVAPPPAVPSLEAYFPDLSSAAVKALSLHLEQGYVLEEHFKQLKRGLQELVKKEILHVEKVSLPTNEPAYLYFPGPRLEGFSQLPRAPLETARWETTHPNLAKGYTTSRLAAVYEAKGYDIDRSLVANRLGKHNVWSTFLAVKDSDVRRVLVIASPDDLEQVGDYITAFASQDIEEKDLWVIAGLQAQAQAFRQLFSHYALMSPDLDAKETILWLTTYRAFIDQKGDHCWSAHPAGAAAARRLSLLERGHDDA
ncbi:MAG: hypothetical protein KM310_00080 [Clostridiales bacterium]|nr:hypothetical protein [Clostridiales bacterium]